MNVTLSEPVLVKRSRWYCWFPSDRCSSRAAVTTTRSICRTLSSAVPAPRPDDDEKLMLENLREMVAAMKEIRQ